MKIIELNEEQFRNYSSIHSRRNYLQTVEYAKMKQEDGYEAMFIGLIDDNNVLAASVILSKKIYNKHKYAYAPWGFLIDYDNKELLYIFTSKIKEYLKKLDYVYLRTNPDIRFKVYDKNLTIIDGNANKINMLKELGYSFMGFKNNFSKFGVYLKVEGSLNSIYNNFSRSIKRNINFCLKSGLTIHKGSMDNFEIFYELIKKNTGKSMEYYRKLTSYFNTDYNRFEIFFAKLNPEIYINNYQYLLKQEQEHNNELTTKIKSNNNSSLKLVNKKMISDRLIEKYKKEIVRATGVYKIFPEGIIIGTCGIIRNNKEIYFVVDGYNEQVNYIHSIPLIKWEIMKIYNSINYKEFYFGPIHSNVDDDTYKGLFQSKVGFGGEIIEYPGDFDLVINKYLYTLYSSFFNMNKNN